MKKLSLDAIKFSSTPKPGFWTQSISFEPQREDQKEIRGKLLAVLSLRGTEEDLNFLGRETANTFLEEYYRDLTSSCLVSLEKAATAAQKKLFTLSFGQRNTSSHEPISLDLIAAAVWGQVLYLCILGEGKIQLSRGGKLATILETPPQTPESLKILSASGFSQDGDLLILATGKFFQTFDGTELEKLARQDLTQMEEFLQTKIYGQGILGVGAILARVLFEDISGWEEKEIINFVKAEEQISIKYKELGIKNNLGNISAFLSSISLAAKSLLLKIRLARLQNIRGNNFLSRQKVLILSAVVFLILAGSVFWQIQKRQEEAKVQKTQEFLMLAQAKVLESEGMAGLNLLREKSLLTEAQQALKEAKLTGINPSAGEAGLRITRLEDKINQRLQAVWKIYKIEPKETGFFGSALVDSGNNLYIFDPTKTSLHKINPAGTREEITLNNTADIKFLAATDSSIYLLGASVGVFKVEDKDVSKISDKESLWGNIADFAGYLDNLYLLDNGAGEIWKYTPGDSSLGTARHFLTGDQKPDLKNARSFAVDGDIWVLLGTGQILKLAPRTSEVLNITGLDAGIWADSAIYTNKESKYLYVLDKGGSRIVVLAKTGEYNSQYQAQILSRVKDFTVLEKEKKIYVVSGDKVYELEMK